MKIEEIQKLVVAKTVIEEMEKFSHNPSHFIRKIVRDILKNNTDVIIEDYRKEYNKIREEIKREITEIVREESYIQIKKYIETPSKVLR